MAYIGNTQQNQSFVPQVDFFSGNGVTTAFTLSRTPQSVYAIEVVVANVPQNPSDAYTLSGNTITFTSAPPSGTNNIYVYYTSPNTQVVQPGQGTVGTNELANGGVTSAKLASGVALANIGTGGVTPSYLSTGAPSWDSSGNLSFNSGYGSVATAYGCRAWVNFNGTGTVAIRASGNVSSITDNGTGNYTVNFTTALSNANYATVLGQERIRASADLGWMGSYGQATTSVSVITKNLADTYIDFEGVDVSVFR